MSKKKLHYIPRIISNEVRRLAKVFPVLTITGPRQSGKTTLCRELFSDYHYVNMGNPSLREQIQSGPKSFLEKFKKGLIIFDGEYDIPIAENGMINFRNIKFK